MQHLKFFRRGFVTVLVALFALAAVSTVVVYAVISSAARQGNSSQRSFSVKASAAADNGLEYFVGLTATGVARPLELCPTLTNINLADSLGVTFSEPRVDPTVPQFCGVKITGRVGNPTTGFFGERSIVVQAKFDPEGGIALNSASKYSLPLINSSSKAAIALFSVGYARKLGGSSCAIATCVSGCASQTVNGVTLNQTGAYLTDSGSNWSACGNDSVGAQGLAATLGPFGSAAPSYRAQPEVELRNFDVSSKAPGSVAVARDGVMAGFVIPTETDLTKVIKGAWPYFATSSNGGLTVVGDGEVSGGENFSVRSGNYWQSQGGNSSIPQWCGVLPSGTTSQNTWGDPPFEGVAAADLLLLSITGNDNGLGTTQNGWNLITKVTMDAGSNPSVTRNLSLRTVPEGGTGRFPDVPAFGADCSVALVAGCYTDDVFISQFYIYNAWFYGTVKKGSNSDQLIVQGAYSGSPQAPTAGSVQYLSTRDPPTSNQNNPSYLLHPRAYVKSHSGAVITLGVRNVTGTGDENVAAIISWPSANNATVVCGGICALWSQGADTISTPFSATRVLRTYSTSGVTVDTPASFSWGGGFFCSYVKTDPTQFMKSISGRLKVSFLQYSEPVSP